VSIFGELWDKGKQLAGSGIDDVARLAAGGLNDVGLHGAAQWVATEGDKAGYDLGADVAELQLGQTSDPAELVHGDPAAIRSSTSRLKEFSAAFGEAAAGMRGLDTAHWTGAAADAFRAKFAPHPTQWQNAADATSTAVGALTSYAAVVESAQGQARQAISLYEQGQQATAAALASYNQQVGAYNSAASAYNAKLAAGQDPGTRPTEPAAFTDPGAALRDQAQQLLAQARSARNAAAAAAAGKISGATNLAPAEPSFWSQVGDDLLDTFQAGNLAQDSFATGIINGGADIVKFVRVLNPEDPWNEEHPAEYVAGVSGTLAGLTADVINPENLVKSVVGTGWGSDPFQAAGKLVPNLALTLLTDGGGAAADAGASAAEDAGTSAGEDAMFSSGSAVSNAEIVKSGQGLPRTPATVGDIASRAGVDLQGSTVRIIEDPEYIRYLDSQGACACAPYELPGEIHLGPASFLNEETLAATLVHEQEHVLQYAAGYIPGSGDLAAMEAAAREAEGPVISRLFGEGK
jgi:flagellar motor protein MotB